VPPPRFHMLRFYGVLAPPSAAVVKSHGGERDVKRRGKTASGEVQGDEVNEPPATCRKRRDGVKTRTGH
jgi:hypothetical protein